MFPAILMWKKLVPSYFEPDKHCSCYLERKKWIPAIWRLKNVVSKKIPAIWRLKNVVYNCQEQGKRL